MNEFITLLPLISVFIIFYAILYIPQRRRNKKHKQMLSELKIGDSVLTDSGIYGRVTNIKSEEITLVLKKGEIIINKSVNNAAGKHEKDLLNLTILGNLFELNDLS